MVSATVPALLAVVGILAGCTAGSAAKLERPSDTSVIVNAVSDVSASSPEDSSSSTAVPAVTVSLPIAGAGTTSAPATTQLLDVDASRPCGQQIAAPHTYDHVIWIWMENKNTSILQSSQAAFLASLVAGCGSASNYRDNGLHPSLPNYIVATSGDAQGIGNDGGPAANSTTADNIFRQVRATGRSARSYLEAMEHNCQLGGGGSYAVKHNPAAYYTGNDDRSACERDAVPFGAFGQDLAAGTLPAFASITPDLCHDMHDCPIHVGDDWLRLVVSSITGSDTYRSGGTVLFIVWDESSGGGRMPFLAVAPSVPAGTVVDAPLGHAALLAFTEDALGISEHLGAASGAPGLGAAFGL